KGYTAQLYTSSLSEVPLLLDPSRIPGGWLGCVYARYNGDTNYDNDADLTLGATTVNGVSWPGWEPIAGNEGDGSCNQSTWNTGGSVFDFGYFASYRPNNWYALPPSVPPGSSSPGAQHGEGCDDCPAVGILPLSSNTTAVKAMITKL